MSRIGSTCPVDSTYNQSTGECDSPPDNECTPYKDQFRLYKVAVPPGTSDDPQEAYNQTLDNMSLHNFEKVAIGVGVAVVAGVVGYGLGRLIGGFFGDDDNSGDIVILDE